MSDLAHHAPSVGRFIRVLLIAHGVVTIVAAFVLVVFPAAIPATVGISLGVKAFLLSYFLAAAELAIAALSLGAARLQDASGVRLVLDVFVIFHLATVAVEVLYLSLVGATPVLLINIAVRIVAAALFLVARRSLRLLGPAA